jgi:hypothetical protein
MCKLAAHYIMSLEIADHPAATVKKYQAWRKPGRNPERLRRVDARRDRAVSCQDRERLGRIQLWRLGIADEAGLHVKFTGFRRRQCLIGGPVGFLKRLEYGSGIGIEGHEHGGKTFSVDVIPGAREA